MPPFKYKSYLLKTKIFSSCIYLLFAVLLVSFTDPFTIKRVSDMNFRYEFYTTNKTTTPKTNKTYYWFKGGAVHSAQGGIVGALLHDKYIKMYHNNQLAEQGEFKKGLKIGIWKTWYPSGVIETTQNWSNGLKSGKYYHYDENGFLDVKGKYKNDQKQGKWIDYIKEESVVYKKGVVVIKKSKVSKAEKFRLKQENNKIKELQKGLKKAEKLKNATNLAAYKATDKANKEGKKENEKVLKEKRKAAKNVKKETKEDSKVKKFLKKIWSKKEIKKITHGQGK